MGFDSEQVEKAKIAGKLHDIGKIGIRDDILLKPSALDKEEWEILKAPSDHWCRNPFTYSKLSRNNTGNCKPP